MLRRTYAGVVSELGAQLLLSSLILVNLLPQPSAAVVIGPWQTSGTLMWDNAPVTPASHNGTNRIVPADPPDGQYFMPVPNTPKNTSWLPYTLVDAAYAERMTAAKLYAPQGFEVTNIYARVYDPSPATLRHGFAIILKDASGKMLDFGVRGHFAPAQIKDRQFDGTTWTIPGGFTERVRTGNNYYEMWFTNNASGTIDWTIVKNENGAIATNSGTTTLSYGPITEIYLNVNMGGTGTPPAYTYKWTHFWTSPAIVSPPPLRIETAGTDATLSWPSQWTTNFTLEATPSLSSPSWTTVTNEPIDDLSRISVTVPVEPDQKFFRLVE